MTELASPEQLPALLRSPPWASGERVAEPPRLDLPAFVRAPHLHWSQAEREATRAIATSWSTYPHSPEHVESFLGHIGVAVDARPRAHAGQLLQASDFIEQPPHTEASLVSLQCVPGPLALALWNSVPVTRWGQDFAHTPQALLFHHGEAAIPGLLRYAAQRPVQSLRAGRWVDSPTLATVALKARRGLKVALPAATEWLLAHPDTSAQVMLRQLFGADDAAREDARAALHVLAAQGLRAALEQAADGLGPTVRAALDAELNADPLLRLPARMPRLPAFFEPARLHRPRLRDGGTALPDEAMRHLGLMLAISRADQPYAGLDAVRAVCTPASLAEFAWDVFEAWWSAGAASKDAWALASLGLLGDDGTMRRMGPRAMRLAKEGAKQRALAMADMLAAHGSDAALMQLSDLAERCKATMVRSRAAAQVDAVAQQRGLSRIELADRLVPTLELDVSRTLDFGPRQFQIGIDETLKPYVKDAHGARLKDLPKPRQSDDATLADAAALRYKRLKTELKALARSQLVRLEQAMVMQRSWNGEDFHTFFVQHPLMRELAARLLWMVTADSAPGEVDACRIAEDGTLADARDERYDAPQDARFTIAHPLRLGAELLAAFGQQFADYQILQPFPQLARETYSLTPEEARATKLERVNGRDIATGAAIGLLDAGWLRGPAEDGGMINHIVRPMQPEGVQARLNLDPGMFVGQLSSTPRQTLGAAYLVDGEGRALAFERLDPLQCSELLRDLYRLAPYPA
jgi:hypothetical protein